MKLKIKYLFILILLQLSFGENYYQSWTKITLDKKITSSFRLEFIQGLRIDNNLGKVDNAFIEILPSYKIHKNIKIELPYRYSVFSDKTKNRLSLSASYQYIFKSISLKYRLKLYKLYEDGKAINDNQIPFGTLIRNKFSLRYKLNETITPYFSGELFYLRKKEINYFNEYKITLGIKVNLERKNSMNFFYAFKKTDISKTLPNYIYILGINFTTKL